VLLDSIPEMDKFQVDVSVLGFHVMAHFIRLIIYPASDRAQRSRLLDREEVGITGDLRPLRAARPQAIPASALDGIAPRVLG
jgi:hypothetical protein